MLSVFLMNKDVFMTFWRVRYWELRRR